MKLPENNMENMSGVANGVFILPKPSPGNQKLAVLGDKNGRAPGSSTKKVGKTPPLKPPKKQRSPGDDTEILRCKRKIHFSMAGKLGLTQQRNPKQMAKRNERERNRVRTINSTFEVLQEYLPPGYIEPKPKNKKMSKVEVLKAAIDYIRHLQEVLHESDSLMAQHGATMLPPHHAPHQGSAGNGLVMVSLPGHNMMSPPMTMPPLQHPQMFQSPPQMSPMQQQQDMHMNTQGFYPTAYHQQQQSTPISMAQGTCSPGSSSYSGAHDSGSGGELMVTPPSSGGGMYSEGPLTPEEEIIMEWLHDQNQTNGASS